MLRSFNVFCISFLLLQAVGCNYDSDSILNDDNSDSSEEIIDIFGPFTALDANKLVAECEAYTKAEVVKKDNEQLLSLRLSEQIHDLIGSCAINTKYQILI
jgi:hypothetical protein